MNPKHTASRSIIQALVAAALFGISTPLAKLLGGAIPPVLLAGLLYAGSGAGLSLWLLLRRVWRAPTQEAPLRRHDLPWLLGAILFGGVLGPVLLMIGLAHTQASTASLLLNLETVFTALLAWFVFKENVDRRVFAGMLAIVVASLLLSVHSMPGAGVPWSALAIAGACLCWAIDNNLTRPIAGADPVHIAALKGGVAGAVNIAIAIVMGIRMPAALPALAAAALGCAGYGISLALFVLALRGLGVARASAYFATAPFLGASVSLLIFMQRPGAAFWVAGALMACGVWLHLSERHAHWHVHEELLHEHRHRHDVHHQHTHDFAWDGHEPHTHPHTHERLEHSHAHVPDLHHRHPHR